MTADNETLDTKRLLGEYNPVGKIIRRMALEYADAVRTIQARGTKEFSRWSRDLYGSAHDIFYQDEPTMAEFGQLIASDIKCWRMNSVQFNSIFPTSQHAQIESPNQSRDRRLDGASRRRGEGTNGSTRRCGSACPVRICRRIVVYGQRIGIAAFSW